MSSPEIRALDRLYGEMRTPTLGYAVEFQVSAGTVAGSMELFARAVDFLTVVSDKECYVGTSSATVTITATGILASRYWIDAAERRIFPWSSSALFVTNAVGGESPVVRAEGWAIA